MSSRLIPPNEGSSAETTSQKRSTSVVSTSMSIELMLANFLNRTDLPSMTGFDARGPIAPRPRTAVPFVMTATILPRAGIKCGPTLEPDDLINLCNKINPNNEKGKITLISRFGANNVSKYLPKLIRAIKKEGLNVIWSCDPCHGNTIKAATGFKTRPFNSVLKEVQNVFACHQSEGTYAGGLHIELTGQNVTECIGGAQKISEEDLSSRYHTHCDPRLNANQALELAFLISDEIKKNSSYSKNANKAAS